MTINKSQKGKRIAEFQNLHKLPILELSDIDYEVSVVYILKE